MNTKKLKIIMTIIIFLLAFPFHFLYDKFSNFIFFIFFPVNESIWEHMKLLFTSIIFSGVIEYIIIKKKDIKVNNYLLSLFIPAILSIPIYLIIFLPIYYKIGENFIITITIMFITILLVEKISYKSQNTALRPCVRSAEWKLRRTEVWSRSVRCCQERQLCCLHHSVQSL